MTQLAEMERIFSARPPSEAEKAACYCAYQAYHDDLTAAGCDGPVVEALRRAMARLEAEGISNVRRAAVG